MTHPVEIRFTDALPGDLRGRAGRLAILVAGSPALPRGFTGVVRQAALRALEEEHCIIYVAITRAKRFCGQLSGSSEHEGGSLPLDV